MSDPVSPPRGFGLRLRLARAALAWERIWPAAWPGLAVVGGFAVLALFDLLPGLPGWAHATVLALFAAALAAVILWGVWRRAGFRGWPDRLAARRRIEVASGLRHRPLQALGDRPSTSLDGAAASLWAAHQRRMAEAARRLRVGWPVAGLARHDPWGVRSVLVILLLLGVIDAGGDWRDRVARAFAPNLAGGAAAVAASFDVWVTPPDYTGLPPQFLRTDNSDNTEPVRVPTGSALLAQVHGGSAAPRLSIDRESREFTAVDKHNFRIEATLATGTLLTVSQGGTTLGRWPIEIVPDNPPTIEFARLPQATPRAALRLDYRAGDDYGVESAKAVIRRDGGATDEAPIEFELPLPGLHLKEAQGTTYQDLTAHPWAGLPVAIRLAATDALGQTGESEPAQMTLPERVFHNPIARAIIDQRKELVKDPNSRGAVAEILGDLNKRPALYRDDMVVYLALSMAQGRLCEDGDPASLASVVKLLWDTALRIEDGSMSVAERDLRRLQQELQDALAKGAPDAEIERLMSELRQALDRYLQSLAEEMQRNPNQAQQPVDPSQTITGRDLQRMLDQARDLARSGARDQARELLSQLQNMLENLRTARPSNGERGSSEAQQMMRGLHELMQRQQQLLDRSFRAQRQAGRPERGGQQPGRQQGQQQPGDGQDDAGQMGEMGEAAGQQESLRRMLGEMMRRLGDGLGDIPEPFGRAERAMRDAAGALQRAQPGQAIGPQTEALDQLQQAAREFAKQMQQKGNGWGEPDDNAAGAADRDQRDREQRDPFGRPLSSNGTYDQGDVKIPDNNMLQKSRQILDELRRRAGERSRPEIELDYIERLLKRF